MMPSTLTVLLYEQLPVIYNLVVFLCENESDTIPNHVKLIKYDAHIQHIYHIGHYN